MIADAKEGIAVREAQDAEEKEDKNAHHQVALTRRLPGPKPTCVLGSTLDPEP